MVGILPGAQASSPLPALHSTNQTTTTIINAILTNDFPRTRHITKCPAPDDRLI